MHWTGPTCIGLHQNVQQNIVTVVPGDSQNSSHNTVPHDEDCQCVLFAARKFLHYELAS